jgi:hypothetical protein
VPRRGQAGASSGGEAPAPADAPEERSDAPGGDEASDLDYYALSVDEVTDALEEGLLSPEEVDELEDARPQGRRKGIDSLLDDYFGEEDEDE